VLASQGSLLCYWVLASRAASRSRASFEAAQCDAGRNQFRTGHDLVSHANPWPDE